MFYIFHIESDKIIKYFQTYNECNEFFTAQKYNENEYAINSDL